MNSLFQCILAFCIVLFNISAINSSAIGDGELMKRKRGSGSARQAGGRSTVVTFFNDKIGVTGIDMYKYSQANVRFQDRKVYPAAVHQNQASTFLYDVFELDGNGMNPILVQIVDFCDKADSSCTNVRKFNFNRLFDVHKSAWAAIGKNDGILKGNYRRVGSISPSELPKSVWSDAIEHGNDWMLCSCKGECNEGSREWMKLSQCTASRSDSR